MDNPHETLICPARETMEIRGPLTRDGFEKLVNFKTTSAYGMLKVEATFTMASEILVDPQYAEAREHAKHVLLNQLWGALYGARVRRYHELLDELFRCGPFGDFQEQRRILNQLHELAPGAPVSYGE